MTDPVHGHLNLAAGMPEALPALEFLVKWAGFGQGAVSLGVKRPKRACLAGVL
ncbi:hypothetical protein [Arthrobacter sp. PGP41]|uniref:hypothetical protein n=1 Tax=Arthrobacter sp. PGP41 TaxID=2079227 RepID=UPI00131A15EB|nr:hypothetical protein [Arthrobacter sp. PGP41]